MSTNMGWASAAAARALLVLPFAAGLPPADCAFVMEEHQLAGHAWYTAVEAAGLAGPVSLLHFDTVRARSGGLRALSGFHRKPGLNGRAGGLTGLKTSVSGSGSTRTSRSPSGAAWGSASAT